MKSDNVPTLFPLKNRDVVKVRKTSVVRVSRGMADTLVAIARQHGLTVHAVAGAFLRDSIGRYQRIDGCSRPYEVPVATPTHNTGD